MESAAQSLKTSGDLIADRRYAYAQAAADEGDWRAAADVLEQAIELAPRWAPAWLALGEARRKLGETDGAIAAYRAALALDPADALGAGPRIATLDGEAAGVLPKAYLRQLFDDYAPRFEQHLTDNLRYRGPALILAALDEVAPGQSFARALDLGCGSGLMGAALRPRIGALAGVDLSPAMIVKAGQRGIYDKLEVSDICDFLDSGEAGKADLVVAADALPYFGDLNRLFAAVSRALSPAGLFAFTAEAYEGEGFRLGEGLRFAHAGTYLRQCGAGRGFDTLLLKSNASRREKGSDAPGWVGVLRGV